MMIYIPMIAVELPANLGIIFSYILNIACFDIPGLNMDTLLSDTNLW